MSVSDLVYMLIVKYLCSDLLVVCDTAYVCLSVCEIVK